MDFKKIGLATASLVASGGVLLGATAAYAGAPSAAPAAAPPASSSDVAADRHTPVTGAEKEKVAAAVRAKNSAVTVERVSKAADGTYRVRGTKASKPVLVHVSKDLATVTVREGRTVLDGRGGCGPAGDGERPSAEPGAA